MSKQEMVKCKKCGNYYTAFGITRHTNKCSGTPAKKNATTKKKTKKVVTKNPVKGNKVKHTYRTKGDKTKTEYLTPEKAIHLQCKECDGWMKGAGIDCKNELCPLWPFRPTKE